MKKERKGTEKNSKKEQKIIPNRKGWNCLDCDANHKWILQVNQNNHIIKNY